jgi:hypothetical protein
MAATTPSDFNDGLLLGLKGTMAQAELHFLGTRLQGGKLNKAKKGELRFPLPVGFCYDEQGHIIPDPDAEVRGPVALMFRLFRETGSAFAVVQGFAERGLRFPKRAYGGAWNGKLIWGRLTHSRVLAILKEPLVCGDVCFRALSVSHAHQRRGRGAETDAGGGLARLASSFAGAPRRLCYGGRVFCQPGAFAEEPHQRRGHGAGRPRTRRLGLAARADVSGRVASEKPCRAIRLRNILPTA